MDWRSALSEVKSLQFDVRLNVTSGLRSFFRVAGQEPPVQKLLSAVLTSGEVREEVLGEIIDLVRVEIDRRYENPNDTALAVLLWLMEFASPEFAELAADLIDRAPQCWYAKKLARRILTPPRVASATPRVASATGGPPAQGPAIAGQLSGEFMMTLNYGLLIGRAVQPRPRFGSNIEAHLSSTGDAFVEVTG